MTDCPCDTPPQRILRIAAGLSALPRQTQAFAEVRIALLAEVARHSPLAGWRAQGSSDFGVMWLEMWAYVADVLGFYDERIANESYLRTAVRRPSLRRIVDLLGYVPAPGIAGSATIAALAEGRTLVSVPDSTAFRSDAFEDNPPQVFEIGVPASVHALSNSWEIGPVTLPGVGGEEETNELIFETSNFGLARNRLLTIEALAGTQAGQPPQVARVELVRPFEGKDGRTYVRVHLDRSVIMSPEESPDQFVIRTPTVTAVVTRLPLSDPAPVTVNADDEETIVFLDSIYRQIHQNARIIVEHSSIEEPNRIRGRAREVTNVEEVTVTVDGILAPLTRITIDESFTEDDRKSYVFHFSFVDAGRLARVAETTPTASAIAAPNEVPVVGLVERPPSAGSNGILEQKFLLRDRDNQGALVDGKMRFRGDGTATFQVTGGELPSNLKTPITVFGNLLETTRGETVFNEILGNGDARQAHQTFKLKKKPLTYLFDPSVEGTHARSTLSVRVDGVLWHEVRSFFGRTSEDRVYIVRPDDQGNSLVLFGDGTRGARLPSGIRNVVATYRFGSGEAAPPAGAIKQLARAVKGLRRVESPVAAIIGKDPDPPEALRTAAPRSALLFGRAVSTLDFAALASLVPSVIKAVAEFLWIESEQEAGVVVTYIGSAASSDVLAAMRKEAEPNLPLVAHAARAWPAYLRVEVEVHPDFDPDTVTAAVKAALIDEQTGPLSRRNAPIGQRLFRSVIFDAIHDVPGVVSVQSAVMTIYPPTGWGYDIDFKSSSRTGACAGTGAYLDFGDGPNVQVSGTSATAPVLGVEAAT